MITEKDRIIALLLICTNGPTEEQIAAKRLTKSQINFGNQVLLAAATKIREGLHNEVPDALVRRVLAGDYDGK